MRLSDLPLDFSGILSNAMWVGQGKIYFDYKEEVKQNTGGYCLCICFLVFTKHFRVFL